MCYGQRLQNKSGGGGGGGELKTDIGVIDITIHAYM